MFLERKIVFIIFSNLINIKNIRPIETKKVLPDWYKKIEKHTIHYRNIKGCMPFLDAISAGYTLPLPQDLFIGHNVMNKHAEPPEIQCFYKFSLADFSSEQCLQYNMNGNNNELHATEQIGGSDSFLGKKNGGNNIIKILNPWKIKTPPGYSCLFTSPNYSENDYFNIISGIVDTDVFDMHINFPMIVNHDKYNSFEKLFKQGTPYVQIIPFKRNSWKKEIAINKHDSVFKFNYFTSLIDRYKNKIWSKKSWK